MEYDFEEQLRIGAEHAQVLDAHFESVGYEVEETNPELQRREIDRIFRFRETGEIWTVEYKACMKAHQTRNIFVETVSVLEKHIPGWAKTSWAQILVYYVVGWEMAYVAPMSTIKFRRDTWLRRYQQKDVVNRWSNGNSYLSRGIPVPERVFRDICYKTPHIEG